MKKIIRLTESELVSLLKDAIIMENKQKNSMNRWGCELFDNNSEDYEWCKCCIDKMKEYRNQIKEEIEYIKKLVHRDANAYVKIKGKVKPYSNTDPFFQERIKQFYDFYRLLQQNRHNEDNVKKFVEKITKSYVFVEKKEEKEDNSLLNKLNTNYSALSYLLTLHRQRNNLKGNPFWLVYRDFFEMSEKQQNEMRESKFTTLILNFLHGDQEESDIMSQVFKTIQSTTDLGKKSEGEAYNYLIGKLGNSNVINFSGDYSFVDLFGVDFMVKGLVDELNFYIPVQVKTSSKDLYGNDKVYENVAIGKTKNGEWKIQLFNGKTFEKEINL